MASGSSYCISVELFINTSKSQISDFEEACALENALWLSLRIVLSKTEFYLFSTTGETTVHEEGYEWEIVGG